MPPVWFRPSSSIGRQQAIGLSTDGRVTVFGWIVLIIRFAQEGKGENRYAIRTGALPS